MSLLILPPSRTPLRRQPIALADELHFDPGVVRRAVAKRELDAGRSPWRGLPTRSALHGFKVADARRALVGLPTPGDYRVVIKPLRYRTRPSLSGLCEFDIGRIIVRIPEPFRPFDELVYFNARRKRGAGMRFAWVAEKVRFRTRREVRRFVYCHEGLHWYLREARGRRAGRGTARRRGGRRKL